MAANFSLYWSDCMFSGLTWSCTATSSALKFTLCKPTWQRALLLHDARLECSESSLVSNISILRMFIQVLILSLLGIVSCKRPIKCSNQTVAFKRLMRATRQFHFWHLLSPSLWQKWSTGKPRYWREQNETRKWNLCYSLASLSV